MSKKEWDREGVPSAMRPDKKNGPVDLELFIRTFSSNLYGVLVKDPYMCRFFKVTRKGEHDWFAILGSWDEEDMPIVVFGNGPTYASAVHSLSRSMAGNAWKPDKFA